MRRFKIEKIFTIDGYKCVIVGQSLGFRCGYVGIPKGHILYEKEYDEIDVYTHGGLTYSNYNKIGYPVEMPDDLWWIGFDCGHSGDGKDTKLIKELVPVEEYEALMKVERMFPTRQWETVRTKEYVEQELHDLVRQVKEMETVNNSEGKQND